ncbi:MAG TPA: MFS transporter [Kineosporiaceae bacterium]|nr:MFS transporter [Kineosporiaceae bacterium]
MNALINETEAPPQGPSDAAKRARAAVGVLFLTNGAIFASLLPRYPEIKADLALSNAEFGLAVSAFPLGALIAGLTAGILIRRLGSARTGIAATALAAVSILVAGVAPTGVLLATGLFLAGAMDAIADVAQNSHGLRIQKMYGRSILNSFHAVWSIGAVAGGALGALAAEVALPRIAQLGVSAVFFSLLALGSRRFLLAGPEPDATPDSDREQQPGQGFRVSGLVTRYGVLAALVLIAASGALVEDAGSTWSAIYLSGALSASPFVAGTGFIALQGSQFVGRLLGDRLVDRYGQRYIARMGGVIVFLGMGTALLMPTVAGTIVGFGLAGLGVATLIPAAMHGADELPGLRPGAGLTIVSWLLRVGFLVSPPVVGAIADSSTLRQGLFVVPLAGLLVVLSARVLAGRSTTVASG